MSYTQLVRLDTTVKEVLEEIGKKKETFSDIIRRLLVESGHLPNEDGVKQIA